MPSEAQQAEAELEQPWKKWHAELNPSEIPEVRDGTLVVENNGGDNSGNHGTTALQKKQVDLSVPKENSATEKSG